VESGLFSARARSGKRFLLERIHEGLRGNLSTWPRRRLKSSDNQSRSVWRTAACPGSKRSSLNFDYNVLCDGDRLEHIEHRRQDEAALYALDAERIPDLTTAGDCCRRLHAGHLQSLQQGFDIVRRKVRTRQPKAFLQTATIDVVGTLVGTIGVRLFKG
jgi:hypothetical protein